MASDYEIRMRVIAQDESKRALGGVDKSLKGTIKTAGAYSTAVAGAIVGVGVAAVASAAEFEKSMSNVNTLLGDNQAHFERLKDGVKEFAAESTKPMSELTESMYDIVSAGIAQEQQMQTLRDSEKLAVAGLGSTKEATDLVTSSMNAFGVTSEQAANTVFEAVQGGKTTVSELAQGFGAVAGTAKEAGVQYEEMLAITSTGTTVGKKASQVWTEQKAVLKALTTPTKEMSELYREIGVKSGKELIETSGGLVGALEALKEASNGNDEAFARALSSSEGLALANQLLGSSYDSFQDIYANMTDGLNSIDLAYEKQRQTVDALWNQVQNQFNVAMIELGEAILPTVADALGLLVEGIQWLKDQWDALTPTQQEAVIQSAEVLAGALALVGGLALLAAAFNPVTLAIGLVVAAIVAASAWLVEHGLTWSELAEGIKIVAIEIWNEIVLMVERVKIALARLVPGMGEVADGMQAEYEKLAENLHADTEQMWDKMNEAREIRQKEAIANTEQNLAAERDIIDTLSGEAREKAVAQYDAHVAQAKQKYGELRTGTTAELQKMKEEEAAIARQASQETTQAMGKMAADAIAEAVKMKNGVTGTMEGGLSGIASAAWSWGAGLVSNLTAGINSKKGILSTAVAGLKSIMSSIHQSYNPEIPVKSWGEHYVLNMVQGIKETEPKLDETMTDLAQIVKDRFGDDGELMEIISKWEGDEMLNQKLESVKSKVDRHFEEIQKDFDDAKKDYESLRIKAAEELEQMTADHDNAMQKMEQKVDDLRQSLQELQTSYELDIGGLDKSIGEKIVQQQDLIQDLKDKIAEATATKDETDTSDLEDKLERESAALETFMQDAVGYEDEIAEARRRASLTDFERFIEDAEAKREALTADFELRQQQIEDEIALVEEAKEQEIRAFEEKMSKYEEVKTALAELEIVMSQKFDAMKENAVSTIDQIMAKLDALEAKMKAVTGKSSFANGGVVPGGVEEFASGGIVTNPTMAIMGEGKYNEAIVPLPDGRSIPVEFRGQNQGGNVTINFGDVIISKEVDGDVFLNKMEDRLIRALQLKRQKSLASN